MSDATSQDPPPFDNLTHALEHLDWSLTPPSPPDDQTPLYEHLQDAAFLGWFIDYHAGYGLDLVNTPLDIDHALGLYQDCIDMVAKSLKPHSEDRTKLEAIKNCLNDIYTAHFSTEGSKFDEDGFLSQIKKYRKNHEADLKRIVKRRLNIEQASVEPRAPCPQCPKEQAPVKPRARRPPFPTPSPLRHSWTPDSFRDKQNGANGREAT